jgi:CBS domain-containing protein
VICPACGHDNLQGLDQCENCGADLRTSDIPHPSGTDLEGALIAAQLSALRPRTPISVDEGTPVTEALRVMRDEGVGCVLVTRDERLVGIFTERDAVLKLPGRSVDGVSIDAVMTPDPVVLRGSDNAAIAIHKMAVGEFRHIPLVEDGRPIGVVSSRDLFGYLVGILSDRHPEADDAPDAPTSTDSTSWPFAEPALEKDASRVLEETPSASVGGD